MVWDRAPSASSEHKQTSEPLLCAAKFVHAQTTGRILKAIMYRCFSLAEHCGVRKMEILDWGNRCGGYRHSVIENVKAAAAQMTAKTYQDYCLLQE